MIAFKDIRFKKDKLTHIRELLTGNEEINTEAIIRGMLRIYQLQTISEQIAKYTTENNGVGFTGFDSEFLTSLAKQFINSGSLTITQFVYVKKSMKKYARQLLKIAMGEIIGCEIEGLIPQQPVSQWVRQGNALAQYKGY